MNEYTHRQTRKKLQEKNIPVAITILGARWRCRRIYWETGNPQWVFREKYGFVILNMLTVRAFNYARMKNRIKKLRIRDMDRICVYRYPQKGWMYEKLKKEKSQN